MRRWASAQRSRPASAPPSRCRRGRASPLAHKTVEHLLLAGLLEIDAQLVALDLLDAAVAELQVEHPFTDAVLAAAAIVGGAGDEVAVDGQRAAAAAVLGLGA